MRFRLDPNSIKTWLARCFGNMGFKTIEVPYQTLTLPLFNLLVANKYLAS